MTFGGPMTQINKLPQARTMQSCTENGLMNSDSIPYLLKCYAKRPLVVASFPLPTAQSCPFSVAMCCLFFPSAFSCVLVRLGLGRGKSFYASSTPPCLRTFDCIWRRRWDSWQRTAALQPPSSVDASPFLPRLHRKRRPNGSSMWHLA